MEIGLSTQLFVNQRLSSHILDQIREAGITQIEIFAARQHLDYHDVNHVRDVAQWFRDHAVRLHSVHAPVFAGIDGERSGGLAISLAYTEKRLRIDSMDEIKRALEAAERVPFRYLVVHLGLAEDEYNLRKFDAAFTSLEHLKIFAKERGVQLLLENTPGDLGGPERLAQFIQYTRLDVKVCFDTGHAHLAGGVEPGLEMLKPYVAALHLHDNHHEEDEHLLPFAGTIEWQPVLRAVRTLAEPAVCLLEPLDHGPEATGMPRVQETIRKINEIPS